MSNKNRKTSTKSNQVKNREQSHSAPSLSAQVRQRDGDHCRVCGRAVIWAGLMSPRIGKLVIINSFGPSISVDDGLVLCTGCVETPTLSRIVLDQLIAENRRSSENARKEALEERLNRLENRSFEPAQESAPALQNSYWVQVAPETAAWLDGHGLMKSWKDRNGKEVPNPLHVPNKTVHSVMRSPFSTGAEELELSSVPVDVTSVSGAGLTEASEQRFVENYVRVSFGSRDGRVACDVKSNHGDITFRTNGKHDGGVRLVFEPFSDSLNECCGDCRSGDDGGMAVNRNDHEISPSVGAPTGAGVGTSDPIGGDSTGVSGVKPETPSVNIQVTASPSMSEDDLVFLLEQRLGSLLDPLRTQQ